MRLGFALLCAAVLLVGASFSGSDLVIGGEKKEKAKDPLEGKKGTTIGKLVAKGPNFIEVQADGEEKARKYVPEWKGGLPNQGGGPDKEILKKFAGLTVGSRIEVEWVFHERFRALEIKVLRAASEKKD
jgi:hypothetical protein